MWYLVPKPSTVPTVPPLPSVPDTPSTPRIPSTPNTFGTPSTLRTVSTPIPQVSPVPQYAGGHLTLPVHGGTGYGEGIPLLHHAVLTPFRTRRFYSTGYMNYEQHITDKY